MIIFSKYSKLQMEKPSNKPVCILSLRSSSHIITLSYGDKRYKLFRIDFYKDGSIFVNFPYYKNSDGIASIIHMPPADQSDYDHLSLTDEACVTSHLVKYSHHVDGEVHFSSSGRVKTEIRKKSIPLGELEGHLFTTFVQGFEGFEVAESRKYDHGWTPKRSTIHFDYSSNSKGAIRFVATWQPFSTLAKQFKAPKGIELIGPKIIYNDHKDPGFGFLLGPPYHQVFNEHVLVLRAHPMPLLDKNRDSMLGFIGGFDSKKDVGDLSREATFLSLIYPVANLGEVKRFIPSMDFIKKVKL